MLVLHTFISQEKKQQLSTEMFLLFILQRHFLLSCQNNQRTSDNYEVWDFFYHVFTF